MEGILPLWKPKGLTSHDCVYKIRKLLGMKKVGHTGTLDPDVTGVLPICLGRATKIAEYITDAGKEYEGEITIGFSTTTEDAAGEIVEEKPVQEKIAIEEIESVLKSLTGEIQQTPPMYSAVKVKGKRLYEYARAGITVERPVRTVKIYRLKLLEDTISLRDGLFSFRFSVHCSKGTYIRTLAVMIGEKFGYPAHMSELIRTASASFKKEDCVTFDELNSLLSQGKVQEAIFPLETGLLHLPSMEISDKLAVKVKNGAVLDRPGQWTDEETVLLYKGRAWAIYQSHPQKAGLIKPVKVLRNE
ncbi:tRNA pseudouridine(55) synthase TruB [Siminovitchia fortis]|uniref:tRNA pseudouridine synthase B n=1 Tax=Siminovitchia fortis TaxID=254758 RepID=A0A443J126_9BACI|nr:tRNA pseudouridine(55) synthase TruB [Siminovitchia fortis]RWR14161.1 tRNA pseudouridine(55) synthase TruB [Siminovitchia fortis]WHY83271.1 tRNA pseudouridine(55) synthase TruB [Siminovitchia fortis]